MLTKNPADVAPYSVDYAADLGEGETISASVWTPLTLAGLTLGAESIAGTQTSIVLSGGTNGLVAQLRNVVTTSAANSFTRVIDIEIVDPAALPLGALPIPLAAVKVRLDIETGDLDDAGEAVIDAQVLGALRAAVDYVEAQSLRVLRRRVMTKKFDRWPCFPLQVAGSPMRDVVSIGYIDENGAPQTLDSADWGWADTYDGACVFLIDSPSLPRLQCRPGAVTVTYEAGYDPAGTVPRVEEYALPARLEQAVVMMTGHLFTNRDAVGTERAYEVPLGVEHLMTSARLWR